eukprot:5845069-Lingulodinium_polyedra.AAC.1
MAALAPAHSSWGVRCPGVRETSSTACCHMAPGQPPCAGPQRAATRSTIAHEQIYHTSEQTGRP